MLEVESAGQVRKSRKKHERSQSLGTPSKGVSTKTVENLPSSEKRKSRENLQESQEKLASLKLDADLSQRQAPDDVARTKKKRRRKRPQSADELNHDTSSITKDQTAAQEDVVRANLYTNDKNKSLEKETKQSYSEALSGWQHSVEFKEEGLRKSKRGGSERGERRAKKKSNIGDPELATAVETAVSADKVRRRIKKRAKEKTIATGEDDITDGVDKTSRARRKRTEATDETVAQGNLRFDDEDDHENNAVGRKADKAKRKSRARENLGYDEEEEGKDESAKEPKVEKQKTGKRRRKKLKESSADLIHRALEKKREDDGHVMCVVIHKADRLKTDLRINHPLVRVHVLDMDTGQYVKKCSRNRAATSYYENQETVDHILPLMTEPFDFKQQKSLVPSWEDVLIINEIYSYFLQRNEGDPNVIIFFEILDFLSMNAIHKLKSSQRSDRGWYQIAWAFLKLVGSSGSPNTDTKIRLQLFYPMKSYRRRPTLTPDVPEDDLTRVFYMSKSPSAVTGSAAQVYRWWCSSPRLPYPSTLYVTVKGIKPPKDLDAAGRSMFAVQEEKGKMTFEELTEKIARGGVSPSESDGNQDGVAWAKLPGQPNRIPNQVMSTLQVGRRGCFVVKFSNDGRKLACGCAEKANFSIFVFETLSSRCCSKFQGHFSIIYDLCWSHDDKELLSASSDGTARSWDVSTDGTPAVKMYPHPCFVYAARYHPQRKSLVITGGFDRLIRIWSNDSDGINGQLLREMDGHSGFINTICFDPSGQFMFSGDSSGTILVWNTFENRETKSKKKRSANTGDVQRWVVSKTVKDPEIKDCIINSVTLHPNGRKLLVHTRDSVTRMLDLRSFSMMTRYIGSNNFKEHVRSTLSTCGSYVFSGSEDGVVHVWDTETGDLLKVYSELGYRAAVSDVDFHPHDNIIAFCSFGENHPVVLYQFDQTGAKEEAVFTYTSPPGSPLHTASRTFGQTTEDMLTLHDTRTMERTSPRMADVASETLLLNKIKKKLDSVLEASSTGSDLRTNMTSSRAFSPDRSTRSPFAVPSDSFQRGNVSLSTWGSDFSALPTTAYDGTVAFSPGFNHSLSSQPGRNTTTFGQSPVQHLSLDQPLSPNQGQTTASRQSSRNAGGDYLFMAKAVYPFEARNADELSLVVDDVITVLRQEDEHWWVGRMVDGRQGFFPASYTALADEKTRKGHKPKEKKQYTAVRTPQGDVKILSAPEDSDGDVMVTKRSSADGRPPRHRRPRDIVATRSSSTTKQKSPRRIQEESNA